MSRNRSLVVVFCFVLAFFCGQSCFADGIVQNGPLSSDVGVGNGVAGAVGFHLNSGLSNASFEATMKEVIGQTLTWWLTDSLGASATVLESGTVNVAEGAPQSVTIFTGRNLGVGNYYVVLSVGFQQNDTGWYWSGSPNIVASPGISYLGSYFDFGGGPSGNFNRTSDFDFSLQGNTATPEPGSLALFASGLGLIVRRLRRS
jgi:hypothetical protein